MSTGFRTPIGNAQRDMLWLLWEHKRWFRGCGWGWMNNTQIERILNSLVRRGLAVARHDGLRDTYLINEAGIAELKKE